MLLTEVGVFSPKYKAHCPLHHLPLELVWWSAGVAALPLPPTGHSGEGKGAVALMQRVGTTGDVISGNQKHLGAGASALYHLCPPSIFPHLSILCAVLSALTCQTVVRL